MISNLFSAVRNSSWRSEWGEISLRLVVLNGLKAPSGIVDWRADAVGTNRVKSAPTVEGTIFEVSSI